MSEEIDPTTVGVPNNAKAVSAMCKWGKKKRDRYAYLVKKKDFSKIKAFDIVENHKGEIKDERA